MASLDTALAELEGILHEAQSSPRLNPAERVKLVMEIRSRVITRIGVLNDALADDPQLNASPDLTREFAERLAGLRIKLAGIQAKWRASELVEKFDLYAVESRGAAEAILDFVKWAKAVRAPV